MARKARPKLPQAPGWTNDQARFDECVDCVFFKAFHADKGCIGCSAGENFKEEVEELDPYADSFLSKRNR